MNSVDYMDVFPFGRGKLDNLIIDLYFIFDFIIFNLGQRN